MIQGHDVIVQARRITVKRILILFFLINVSGVGHSLAQEVATPSRYDIDYLMTVIDKQQRALESMQAQVNDLNGKIEQLQTKLEELSGNAPTLSIPAGLAAWRRQLKRNMTHEQVRQILGEPKHISHSGNDMDFWYYGDEARVTFSDGRVFSFEEPKR